MVKIDALVYFRISDPRVAVYQVQNLPDAIEVLTQSTLRDIIARMSLDDTFSSRETINDALNTKIQRDCERWGVTITRVEVRWFSACRRCAMCAVPPPPRNHFPSFAFCSRCLTFSRPRTFNKPWSVKSNRSAPGVRRCCRRTAAVNAPSFGPAVKRHAWC